MGPGSLNPPRCGGVGPSRTESPSGRADGCFGTTAIFANGRPAAALRRGCFANPRSVRLGQPEHLSTSQGRRGWLREAKRQLDEERAKEARPIPRARPARLKEAKRRLQEELWVESRANAAYEAYRVQGRASDGKRLGAAPTPYSPPEVPQGKVNLADPDSWLLKATHGFLQGYNAQAAVNEDQIVIASEVTVDSPHF